MLKDKYVFAQLVQFLDRNHFNYIVRKYGGGKYIKSFTYWNQLLTMIFGQLTDRESLRSLIVATEAHCNKLYHWDLENPSPEAILAKPTSKATIASSKSSFITRLSGQGKNVIAMFSNLEAMSTHSTQLQSTFVWRCSSGPSSAKIKVESRSIHSMTLKRKSLHSCILHPLRLMIQRLCLRYP